MIDVCPGCKYSLRGLPERHTCPECAFRYDREASLAARPRLGLLVYRAVSACILMVGVALWWYFGLRLGPALLSSIGLQGVAVSQWRLRGRNPFVLVSREELRIFGKDGQEHTVRMDRVNDVEWSRIDGGVTVKAFDGQHLAVIPPGLLGSSQQSRALAEVIKQYLPHEASAVENR